MKLKTKLIQTKDYLLLIDEKAEIKEGKTFITKENIVHSCYGWNYGDRVVVAYYPLTDEAKELDLPLLPNPFNKQIDEVTHLKNLGHECFIQMKKLNPSGGMKEFIRMAVEFGYKAAQSKGQYSLEDIKKAFNAGYDLNTWEQLGIPNEERDYLNEHEFIQSLSTQQLPKEFAPEYEYQTREGDWKEVLLPSEWFSIDEGDNPKRLKTITNSEGKEELVGTYK